MIRKVRVNSKYRYEPVAIDRFNPPYEDLTAGDIVRVVNFHGCPKANTMGHCHVVHLDGRFGGLVHCNLLQPLGGGK